jgi:hypothetical protein
MEQNLASFSSEDLITMYHRINADLTKQFLNRVPWNEQQERINSLSKISKELSRRSIEFKRNDSSVNSLDARSSN